MTVRGMIREAAILAAVGVFAAGVFWWHAGCTIHNHGDTYFGFGHVRQGPATTTGGGATPPGDGPQDVAALTDSSPPFEAAPEAQPAPSPAVEAVAAPRRVPRPTGKVFRLQTAGARETLTFPAPPPKGDSQ